MSSRPSRCATKLICIQAKCSLKNHPICDSAILAIVFVIAIATSFHCDQNHLLPVWQSTFRRHHSTETAVLIIIPAIDKGRLTVMMFLDLSSAFDTVDHDIMLYILHCCFSVEGVALKWFYSYLTDCLQMFSVGDSKSEYHRVSCSVPRACGIRGLHWGRCWSVRSARGQPPLVRWRLTNLAARFSYLSNWCTSGRLQLNAAKTELSFWS